MADFVDLSDCRVLVLEDSYYLAFDLARALKAAGADVIGPCANEAAAFAAIARNPPTCGILDINLGAGPSFEVAQNLEERGLPFLFVTGHEDAVIPRMFVGASHVQKPVDPLHVVRVLAGMLTARNSATGDDRSARQGIGSA